ncbi:NACHT domain-containing protein [Nostoc muscorum FACHB-395]|nr:NACHT domain-containing protein [Desmonostoc muscorum FACHB-395]
MPGSEDPKQVSSNDLRNSQFGGGFINADTVNAGRIGDDIYNIHLEQQTTASDNLAQLQNLDWRKVCTAMLESQQEAAKFRCKATEQGFEINVFVPLGLVERKQQQRRQLNEQPDRENIYELTQEVIVKTYKHYTFIREVIAQQPTGNNKHIAIIGEPGAGKTTLLNTIASFVKDKTQDLPICISLANLQGRTIEEYLLKQWLPEAIRLFKSNVVVTSAIESQLIECFRKSGVWLLLDGVDEMGEKSSVQTLAKINQELTASLRQARVVLTCRLNVWDAQVNNTLTGFDTYKTQEFKQEQIDDFIQQWFECAGNLLKGNTLQAKLKETKHVNIRKLVTNPLRLSLLCQTFNLNKQGELPETKAALYQRFTRYLYEWKSNLFPELYKSDNLKDELHHSLSKLAFASINAQTRFRLTKSLARQEMGEKLFRLACDSFWLVLVDRVAETDEEVYAFFHPNFQEYFAALNVNDWQQDFFDHVPGKPTKGTYRIFEPHWKEVILLWLGREDIKKEEKEKFIQSLIAFNDGCENFYQCQAYCLAVEGIAEFKDCLQADRIIDKLIDWAFNAEYTSIRQLVKGALNNSDRTRAIKRITLQLASNKHIFSYEMARFLHYIDPGNQEAQIVISHEELYRQSEREKGEQEGSFITLEALEQLWKYREDLYKEEESALYQENNQSSVFFESIKIQQEVERLKYYLREDILEEIFNQNGSDYFDIAWENTWCYAQSIPYPDFYSAWHRGNDKAVELNYLDLPQRLQAAIYNDSQLSQNIHLICIDSSKFIDPNNPASNIYTAIVKSGYPKCADGTPKTMIELQTYWDLLETDKQVVLLFYLGTTNITGGVTYSNIFLNSISRFEGKICFISDPIPNCNTLQVFTPNQSVDEILEWLRCS